MKKFENWFILVSVFLCLYSFVAWGEDGQAFALCALIASIGVKYLCATRDEELKKAHEMGKAYKKGDEYGK